jgi:hypothetical protein
MPARYFTLSQLNASELSWFLGASIIALELTAALRHFPLKKNMASYVKQIPSAKAVI